MPSESDRDILIDLRSKVTEMHREMTQPGGRVPKLEATVLGHDRMINRWSGAIWIIGGVVTLIGGALLEHLFAGAK